MISRASFPLSSSSIKRERERKNSQEKILRGEQLSYLINRVAFPGFSLPRQRQGVISFRNVSREILTSKVSRRRRRDSKRKMRQKDEEEGRSEKEKERERETESSWQLFNLLGISLDPSAGTTRRNSRRWQTNFVSPDIVPLIHDLLDFCLVVLLNN